MVAASTHFLSTLSLVESTDISLMNSLMVKTLPMK